MTLNRTLVRTLSKAILTPVIMAFSKFLRITDVGFHPDNILTQDDRKHGNFNSLDSGTLHLENIYKIYFSSGYMTEISVELNQLIARS